jgi:hypothetical protein
LFEFLKDIFSLYVIQEDLVSVFLRDVISLNYVFFQLFNNDIILL